MSRTTEISVVVPALDEVTAIEDLVMQTSRVLADYAFEIIVVDDGSSDGTTECLRQLCSRLDWLRSIHNPQSVGQSGAIRQGVRLASGGIIVTLDGDGQNPPDQIPVVLAPLLADCSGKLGLVQGERVRRLDSMAKRLGSGLANWIRGGLLRDGVRDSGCGLKAFRRTAYHDLPWFDHIHRFMAAMMLREGWHIQTVPVAHLSRSGGRSKYNNLQRAMVGVVDLLGVVWLKRRAKSLPKYHPPKP